MLKGEGTLSENYYDEILAEIRRFTGEENWEEAARLLEEELSMPYIPSGLLKELEQLNDTVRSHLVKEKPSTLISPDELLEYLTRDTESAFAALETLRNGNIRRYCDPIQEYLLLEKGDNLLKALLLELCALQQVSVPLFVKRNGRMEEYIPSELKSVRKSEILPETVEVLKEFLENDNPSFLEQCLQVLVQYLYSIYPEKSALTARQMALAIIKYVFKAYGDDEGFTDFCRRKEIEEKGVREIII